MAHGVDAKGRANSPERHVEDPHPLIGRLPTQRCVTTVFCVNAKVLRSGSLLFQDPRSPSRALATSWRGWCPNRWLGGGSCRLSATRWVLRPRATTRGSVLWLLNAASWQVLLAACDRRLVDSNSGSACSLLFRAVATGSSRAPCRSFARRCIPKPKTESDAATSSLPAANGASRRGQRLTCETCGPIIRYGPACLLLYQLECEETLLSNGHTKARFRCQGRMTCRETRGKIMQLPRHAGSKRGIPESMMSMGTLSSLVTHGF